MLHCARRSLSSKVVSQYSSLLSPMAVDAVLRVLDPQRPDLCAALSFICILHVWGAALLGCALGCHMGRSYEQGPLTGGVEQGRTLPDKPSMLC